MCGRFTLTNPKFREIAESLGIRLPEDFDARYRPRSNITPGDLHWIVLSDGAREKILEAALWGLVPRWAREPKGFINARVETIEEKPAFRDAARAGRCAVPADGFYEWTGPRTDRTPHWFHLADGSPFFFAGLREDRDDVHTFTIVTCEARGVVKGYHDRMPVIIGADVAAEWVTRDLPKPRRFLESVSPPSLIEEVKKP